MILPIHALVRSRMAEAVARAYGIPAGDPLVTEISLEAPPRRALGDVAVPIAFALARRLRKAPRAIAQELVAALGTVDGFSRIEAAPNGYVNLFLDRPHWLKRWTSPLPPKGGSHEMREGGTHEMGEGGSHEIGKGGSHETGEQIRGFKPDDPADPEKPITYGVRARMQ